MTETSYFWEGQVTGDATLAPYTNDELSDVFRELVQLNIHDGVHTVTSKFGEIYRRGDEILANLEVYRLGLSAIVVAPGAAIIDGKVYCLREAKEFACRQTGYYRLILRKEFPALDETGNPKGQTVKLEMLYSRSASSSVATENRAPTPTRIDGITWDLTLAMFYFDGYTREFYYNDSETFAQTGYYSTVIGAREIGKRLYPFGAVSIPKRQGGSSTNWSTVGSTNYVVPMSRVEVGSVTVGSNPQAVTFCEAFSNSPIVIITPRRQGDPWDGNNLCISAISTAGFSVRFDSIVDLDHIQYMAIGPI